MRKTFMIIAAILTLTSCKSLQPFQLTFGSGGGFAGMYTIYTLSEAGKLYKTDSKSKDQALVATLTKNEVKDLEAIIAKVNFPGLPNINKPGNMSRFVNLTKDGHAYTNTWSDASSGSAALDELANKLDSYTSKK